MNIKSININSIKEPIPMLIIFIIVAICIGKGAELFTQSIFEWVMLIGEAMIVSSIISIFEDSFNTIKNKLIIGFAILFIGGLGQAYIFPSPESYTSYEVTQQRLHRTDFSESMTKRIQHEDEIWK